jgi:hypothetical protein
LQGISRVDIAVLVALFSVLAMVAVPRHLDLSAAARRAEVDALAASVDSATEFAHAAWRAVEQPPTLSLSGGDVVMINGFPSTATIAHALEPGLTRAFEFHAGRWTHRERAGGDCAVIYRAPAAPGDPPVVLQLAQGC